MPKNFRLDLNFTKLRFYQGNIFVRPEVGNIKNGSKLVLTSQLY